MGITNTGGFLQAMRNYRSTEGRYEPDTKTFKRIVSGRVVHQAEMLDMARVRWEQPLGGDMPVERVAFVFMEERQAQELLHECWLREIEVYAIVRGREVRLDDTYTPTPERPAWAQDVERKVYEATGWPRPAAG